MERSKLILGLKRPSEFSLEERKIIIDDWLSSGRSKREIWEKYTGESTEHGKMLMWMRELGYDVHKKCASFNIPNSDKMAKPKSLNALEVHQMQEKIKELEKALVNSELRATALETMIEVAEKELKINIKKKSFTKQSIR